MEDRFCEAGRFGQKTLAGWYCYDEGRHPAPDPEVEALVRKWAEEAGIPQRTISPRRDCGRLRACAGERRSRILEERIAVRPVDIDIIYTNGYSFPAHRSGLMWYADSLGVRRVYDRILEFHEHHGELWQPAPLLKHLAGENRRFADFDTGAGRERVASSGE